MRKRVRRTLATFFNGPELQRQRLKSGWDGLDGARCLSSRLKTGRDGLDGLQLFFKCDCSPQEEEREEKPGSVLLFVQQSICQL